MDVLLEIDRERDRRSAEALAKQKREVYRAWEQSYDDEIARLEGLVALKWLHRAVFDMFQHNPEVTCTGTSKRHHSGSSAVEHHYVVSIGDTHYHVLLDTGINGDASRVSVSNDTKHRGRELHEFDGLQEDSAKQEAFLRLLISELVK